MELTKEQREKLIKAIQTGICIAAFLFTTGAQAKSRAKQRKEREKLSKKQERSLQKQEYRLQKQLLKEEYRQKMGKGKAGCVF